MDPASQFWTRRIIWLLLALATAVFLVVKVKAKMYVSRPALDLYQAVEDSPKDKLVVLSCNWEAGTQGENGPQTEALMRHCMETGRKFAIFGWAFAPGPGLAQQIAERLGPEYHYRYGKDWVNWGFRTGTDTMIRAWAANIPEIIEEDVRHTPVAEIPVMSGVRSVRDVSIILEITPSNTLPVYVRYVYGIYRTPLGYACTGVMAPEAFPYYDAHQIVGVLKGLAGAAEYEELIHHPGVALQRMPAQSSAHVLIILLIVLGNVIYFRARRRGEALGRRLTTS